MCVCIKWLILPKKHMKIMAQNIEKVVKPRVLQKSFNKIKVSEMDCWKNTSYIIKACISTVKSVINIQVTHFQKN